MANAKKPGPAPRPTPKANGKPPAPPADLDDDEVGGELDDDLDDVSADGEAAVADSKKISPGRRRWMATQKLPPGKREAKLAENLADKVLARRIAGIAGWDVPGAKAAVQALNAAMTLLKEAQKHLEGIDTKWRPSSTGNAKAHRSPIVEGAKVRVADKHLERYSRLKMSDKAPGVDCTRGIIVAKVDGNQAEVDLPDGRFGTIPLGHLVVEEATA